MGWRRGRQYFSVRMPAEGTNMEPIGELRAPHPWENLIFHREGRTVTPRGDGCLPTLLYRVLNFVKGKAETRGTRVQTTCSLFDCSSCRISRGNYDFQEFKLTKPFGPFKKKKRKKNDRYNRVSSSSKNFSISK